MTVDVEIQGRELPGRECPAPGGGTYENVHVGLRFRQGQVDLVPADADGAVWRCEVTVRVGDDGAFDFGGPHIYGPRGERAMALRWGTVAADGTFTLFRAAKLRMADVDRTLVRAAAGGRAVLVGRLALTDRCGMPRCASVRPPDVEWSVLPR